jgi:radical SAM-linked protein
MKLRIRYSKLGKIRFTSHRDTAHHWERAVRKGELVLAYSGGFTPRPRMSFGLALPTGGESRAEYLDIELAEGHETDPAEVGARLAAGLPMGYEVTAVAVREAGSASLQEDVVACTWEIALTGVEFAAAQAAAVAALAATELVVERERKGQRSTDDVRAAIQDLSVTAVPDDPRPHLCAVLATNGRGLRPTELVGALFPALDPVDVAGRVVRTHQWIERDGVRQEVLQPGPVATRTPVECA